MSLAWPVRGRGASGAGAAAVMLTALVLAAGASWIASDMVHRPATGTELIALDRADARLLIRLVAIRQSFGVLRDFPWFGSGLGTWAEVFPMYQRYPLLGVGFSHAHDDYVQWVEETGVVGLGLLGVLTALYFASVLRPLPMEAAKRRAALFGTLAAAAFHSTVDFGLHIPANALLFAAILGLLWRETSGRDAAAKRSSRASRGGSSRPWRVSPGSPCSSVSARSNGAMRACSKLPQRSDPAIRTTGKCSSERRGAPRSGDIPTSGSRSPRSRPRPSCRQRIGRSRFPATAPSW